MKIAACAVQGLEKSMGEPRLSLDSSNAPAEGFTSSKNTIGVHDLRTIMALMRAIVASKMNTLIIDRNLHQLG
jgi:hypothetical protein